MQRTKYPFLYSSFFLFFILFSTGIMVVVMVD
jgi:hypothetical protein